jgi:pyruvate dehydrogenase E2 component (dihydrolipoamide acetyltransferase)
MKTFTLPDLGEGLQEAEIVAWHVEVGDDVVTDQPLLAVETDKAVVEVPSPATGTVSAIHAEPGDMIAIGANLVDFAESVVTDSGVIVGELAAEATVLDEEPAHPAAHEPAPAPEPVAAAEPIAAPDPVAAPEPVATPPAPAAAAAQPGVRVKASPAVRALAKKLGVDLGAITGSGPGGAIATADVERAGQTLASFEPAEPLRGVRRAMARKMAQSHAEVVPTTVNDEADIDAWLPGTDITFRLIRAIARGCAAEPALNAWYDGAAETRRLLSRVDIGVAAHTEDGLFVPVMRDVAARDVADIRRGLDAMKADVKARAIPPDELKDPTITLSNFGVFGAGRHAALIVIPPQVAIVGAGRIENRVVPILGGMAVHRILPLSLTFDHRPVNGGEASGFLAAMIADLERFD